MHQYISIMIASQPYSKFTIIVPTLNAETTIQSALNSLASQTYTDFEVLVYDGKSSDNTLQIVEEYTSTDARFFCVSEKDDGIYDAMNKSIKRAKGEWLFFLGSDDRLYDKNVLADVAATIRKNQGVKLVYGNVQLNKPLGYHHQELTYAGEFDADKLLKKNLCHQSVFYHRSLFKRYGQFKTEYQIFADYDFNLRCFNRVKPVYMNRIIANFNVGGHSTSHQDLDPLFDNDFLENMALHYSFPYHSAFFDGRKKELLGLIGKRLRQRRLQETFRIARILSYQTIKAIIRYRN
jgi:glycosyltransferase involved in cell wall biosynthesis